LDIKKERLTALKEEELKKKDHRKSTSFRVSDY